MRRIKLIAGGLFLAAPLVPLQAQIRWNDTASETWLQEAPRVRVWIDGPRLIPTGGGLPVRVEVSDDAYVVVGKVDSWGQLTILYPYTRAQRNVLAANFPLRVSNPIASRPYYANDAWGGFVFAIASYSPIDLTTLEYHDFRPTGIGFSPFTQANRQLRLHPEQYIGNLATMMLWDGAVPYDYDYDFYRGYSDWGGFGSALAFCGSAYNRSLLWSALGLGSVYDWPLNSYRGACGNYMDVVRCISLTGFYQVGGCPYYRRSNRYAENPPTVVRPGTPSSPAPDAKVIAGVSRTDTVKGSPAATRYAAALKTPGGTKVAGEALGEWDGVYSIPRRAITKLKQGEAGDADETATREYDLSQFRPVRGDLSPPRRSADLAGDERTQTSRPASSPGRDFDSPSRNRRAGSNGGSMRDAPRISAPRRTATSNKPASSTVKPGKSSPTIKATRSPSSGTKSTSGAKSTSGGKSSSGKSSSGKTTKPPPQ